jgi:protein CpxP
MKSLAPILVLVFAFTLTAIAQKKKDHQRWRLTVAQQTELTLKKMTLALDLNEKQQLQIRPLLLAKIVEKKAFNAKRKEAKERKERPTSDAAYATKIELLEQQIAMKKSMKEILNTTQFKNFEKMHKKRMTTVKKERQRRKKRATG